jgi:septal ring factor EnvC (AmiA/AmiB activator)
MTYLTPAQGRQPKIGVMFLAWLNIYQNLKQAIQDVIAPEMQQLCGDIKAQNREIKALSSEIAALRQELTRLKAS